MSSAPEGWYVDPSTGKNLRLWDGDTWTDEVAPLPYEATHSGPVDLLAAPTDAYVAAPVGLFDAAQAAAEAPAIDPEIERTLLTRRELRARSGAPVIVDDVPKHLPPAAPPAAVSVEQWEATAMPLEIPGPGSAPGAPSSGGPSDKRRNRILRLSVLLGILAVATSVAVLTAGTI